MERAEEFVRGKHWSAPNVSKPKVIKSQDAPDYFSSRLHSLRDWLRDLGKDVHPMGLTFLVVDDGLRIYKPVRELHLKDDNYSLDQIQSTVPKIYR